MEHRHGTSPEGGEEQPAAAAEAAAAPRDPGAGADGAASSFPEPSPSATVDRPAEPIPSPKTASIPERLLSRGRSGLRRIVGWLSRVLSAAIHHPALHGMTGVLGLAIFFLSMQTDRALHRIHEHLTTHYVGEFPGSPFLPEITRILTEAKQTIGIACDFPGYGMYSTYSNYLEYKTTLLQKQDALEKGKLRIVVLSPEHRARILTRYFPDDMNMVAIRQTAPFQEFARRHSGLQLKTPTDLRRANEEDQKEVWHDLSALERRAADNPMPLHLWIVDGTVAVFTIPHATMTGTQESAFVTRDSRLIARMQRVFESYWSSGTVQQEPAVERGR